MEKNIDEALAKKAKLELLVNLFDNKMIGNFHNKLEESN